MNSAIRKLSILFLAGMMALVAGLPAVSSNDSVSSPISSAVADNGFVETIVSENDGIITITYDISGYTFEDVEIEGSTYTNVVLGEEPLSLVAGEPALPKIRRSIVIPDTLEMGVEVVDATYEVLEGVDVIPSKGNLLRDVNPEEVPYEFGDIYDMDTMCPSSIVKLHDPYVLRDVRGQVVEISPVQVNPVTGEVRLYSEIIIQVSAVGDGSVNVLEREGFPESVDADYLDIYNRHFLNFGLQKYTPVSERGNMLIIVYDGWESAMEPFVEWKTLKGIPVEMVSVSSIGNNDAIKSYVTDYYNSEGLVFLLLVGDAAQVEPYYSSYYDSDTAYAYVEGSDSYPEFFVGRFSAETEDQVITQVERTVSYEMTPEANADWYHKGTGIASNQGTGDDGEYDDEHMDNIRDDLLAYTYSEVDQIYDPSASVSMVANALNDGRSIVNYCGHGSTTSWGSSDFSNSDINQLSNDNMLPVVFSVACSNGDFNGNTCFGEAWLRATNNGEPIGALGAYMSTKSQSWDPPMDSEDEYVDIIIETYSDNIKTTFGALCYHGSMHMNDEYPSGGPIETDCWTVFGDPSVMIYTDTPAAMNADYLESIPGATEQVEITVPGCEGALCALSNDGEIIGTGYTDGSGHVVIAIPEAIPTTVTEIDIVITAKNKMPVIDAIEVMHSEPPMAPTASGPELVKIDTEVSYAFSSTDPEGEDVEYYIDWGDGTVSDWDGPHASGASVTKSHTYDSLGTFEVTAQARDPHGVKSEWSTPLSVVVAEPRLSIGYSASGFLKLSSAIRNRGGYEAEDVDWEILLEGGVLLTGREFSGTIESIPADGEEAVSTGMLIGFGKFSMTVHAQIPGYGQEERVQNFNAYLFYFDVSL